MQITKIECLQIRSPQVNPHDCDGAAETVVIRITAENGVQGIGETDAPPNVIAALLETPTAHIWSRSVRDLLLGENALEVEQLWDRVYEGTIYHARRGLGIMLLSAIDIALHDLRGKLLGVPCFRLLGGPARQAVIPLLIIAMKRGPRVVEMRRSPVFTTPLFPVRQLYDHCLWSRGPFVSDVSLSSLLELEPTLWTLPHTRRSLGEWGTGIGELVGQAWEYLLRSSDCIVAVLVHRMDRKRRRNEVMEPSRRGPLVRSLRICSRHSS